MSWPGVTAGAELRLRREIIHISCLLSTVWCGVVWCGGVLQHAMPDSRKSASPALRTVIEWEVCGVYFEISPGSFSMTQNTAALVYIDTLYFAREPARTNLT